MGSVCLTALMSRPCWLLWIMPLARRRMLLWPPCHYLELKSWVRIVPFLFPVSQNLGLLLTQPSLRWCLLCVGITASVMRILEEPSSAHLWGRGREKSGEAVIHDQVPGGTHQESRWMWSWGGNRGTWQHLGLASVAFWTADSQSGTPRKSAIEDATFPGGMRGKLTAHSGRLLCPRVTQGNCETFLAVSPPRLKYHRARTPSWNKYQNRV